MGITDKSSNKASTTGEDLKGKGKEAVGKVTGDKGLERQGKSDQAKSAVRQAGDKVKDAGDKVKDAASKAKDAITGD